MNAGLMEMEKAIQLHEQGDFNAAKEIYEQLLEKDSDNIQILYMYSVLLVQQNDIDQAIYHINRIFSLKPDDEIYIESNLILTQIYLQKNNINKALEHCNNVIEIDPENIQANLYSGNAFFVLNDFDKALNFYSIAAKAEPVLPELYLYMGLTCLNKKDGINSIRFFEKAISQKPNYTEAYINLAQTYYQTMNIEKAIQYNLKAKELNPNFMPIYNNLANIYLDICDIKKAKETIDEGLKLFHNDTNLLLCLGRLNMLTGNYKEGWEYFKHRRLLNENKALGNFLLDYQGSIKNKNIYVHWDTGFGDTIQFARYAYLLKEKGAKVFFRPQNELSELLSYNYPDIVTTKEDIKFDYQINLTSLAYLFQGDIDGIELNHSYIKAAPAKVELYKQKYFNNEYFKLGIVWQTTNISNKSIESFDAFSAFANMPNVKIYSLLKDNHNTQLKGHPNIINLGSTFSNFSDTAAAIENLDLLITIDTATAHLAGAMGKPVWILLPSCPNWRWLLDTQTSPWYKSARLFRQKTDSSWQELVNEVYQEFQTKL